MSYRCYEDIKTQASAWEAALAAGWKNAEDAGQWTEVVRTFRDGHQERWWALEVEAGPYGTQRARRALVATTDPERLPRLGTWYLTTNLPVPTDRCEQETNKSALAPASVAEVVRLFGFRMWVEQSYKQVKHALGWSQYQVRSDLAIRRHWQLVCLAFSFCWWAYGRLPTEGMAESDDELPAESEGRGKKETQGVVAGDLEGGEGLAGALCNALAIVEGVYRSAPSAGAKSAA